MFELTRARMQCALFLAVAMMSIIAGPAHARPQYGSNCSSCHVLPPPNPDSPDPTGFDTTANPTERPGKPDRGTLKVFNVNPGQSVDLDVLIDFLAVKEDHRYAIALRGASESGVEFGGNLAFTADPDWTLHTLPPTRTVNDPYYTIPAGALPPNLGGINYAGPTSFTFTMNVGAGAVPDYYYLEFVVGGRKLVSGPAQLFSGHEGFYLHVIPEPGSLGLLGFAAAALLARRRGFRNRSQRESQSRVGL